jgi:hypothetical protein
MIFAVMYLVFTNYSFPIGNDESEYVSIGRSFIHGEGFSIYGKPTTLIVTVPILVSFIWGSGLDYETSLMFSRILFTVISVINLFLITQFLKKIKIDGKKLSINRILLIQLLTFANFTYWAGKGTILTEPLSLLLLFSIINILNKDGNSYWELAVIGVLSALLILTKYVTAVIIPVLIISSIRKYGISSKLFRSVLSFLVPLLIIITPFLVRAFTIESSIDNIVSSNFARFSSSQNQMENILVLAFTGLKSHLFGFVELYSTFIRNPSLFFSMLFYLPILIFIFNRIKSREIFRFYVMFPFFYIAGLIFSGVGFDRYWVLILPLLNLFLVYQVSEWKIFRVKLKVPAFLKGRLYERGIIFLIVIFLISICFLTFQSKNFFQYKWYLFIYCLIFSFFLMIYSLSKVKYFYLYSLIFLIIISFNFSRSVNVFVMLCRSLPERAVQENMDENEISEFLKKRNEAVVYTDGYLSDWSSVMINRTVRHTNYKYNDEKDLGYVYYIERSRDIPEPRSFKRDFSKYEIALDTKTFRVFKIILN